MTHTQGVFIILLLVVIACQLSKENSRVVVVVLLLSRAADKLGPLVWVVSVAGAVIYCLVAIWRNERIYKKEIAAIGGAKIKKQ